MPVAAWLFALGCTSEASKLADNAAEPAAPAEAAAPIEPALPSASESELPPEHGEQAAGSEGGPTDVEPNEAPPLGQPDELPSDPPDSQGPAVPAAGPAPGSPEADAELEELLDESTLTQEEFDQAFRGGGPKIKDDQFVFGADERAHGRPLVDVGSASVSGSSVAPSKLADMARASQRDLVGCYAMALGKDPKAAGSVTMKLRFDAKGGVSSAQIEGGSSLGAALDGCLVSVAKDWRLAAAAGATVRMPLTLSSAIER